MSNFEFVFSLFGLLLGLALAEVLGGFGTAIQSRKKVRIGWLTPLMALLVALDITSFWMIAWSVREQVPAQYASLLGGLLLFGLYYLIARLTFPHHIDDWPDYDAYYFEHRLWVLGGMALCNMIAIGFLVAFGIMPLQGSAGRWSLALFVPGLIAAMVVKDKRINIALLILLIVQYPIVSAIGLLGAGR